jgi:hypothetical protein
VRPALEIRGLNAMRKRFAALGAVKSLGPALRAEAEAVADAARERLRGRDPRSRLAQPVKIIELEAGINRYLQSEPTIRPGSFSSLARLGGVPFPGLCQFWTLVYRLLTMRSER